MFIAEVVVVTRIGGAGAMRALVDGGWRHAWCSGGATSRDGRVCELVWTGGVGFCGLLCHLCCGGTPQHSYRLQRKPDALDHGHGGRWWQCAGRAPVGRCPVSYTHLPLPTI